MSSVVSNLCSKQLITPPPWLKTSVHYETMMGSVAYGVSDDTSDQDIYGFCIPLKDIIFPHLKGHINGFGKKPQEFWQYQEHHIKYNNKEYDITIYNIVKYFQLCMENNPNAIDSLFTPQFCVLHLTRVGNMVRENRRLFLHKGCWPKFKGYSYSQLHKARTKNPIEGSKRRELLDKYGMETKFLYHVIRLLDEAEQILTIGDIDLQRNREHLKAIRKGEVKEEEIFKWASDKEKQLEEAYHKSSLPWGPQESKIKKLLLNCLEEYYGNLDSCVVDTNMATLALKEVAEIIEKKQKYYLWLKYN